MTSGESLSELPGPYPPKTLWILGAGRFGRPAAGRLRKRYPRADLLVVDRRAEKLEPLREDPSLSIHVGEALSFLSGESLPADVWIVPAIPVHVAFHWILQELGRRGLVSGLPVPPAVDALVPNPLRRGETLYASYATFICPDACSEPEGICTHTGGPRRGNLFECLGRISLPGYRTVVVRSMQLAPGVGGYPGWKLREALEDAASSPGQCLIATSCRCHGVIDGLSWMPSAAAG